MASAITLEGIDQAISNLQYKNENTLKYRFVQYIRQYYASEDSVVNLNEIDHEALIIALWDTDHSLESIKNKRKNLNSVRSTVNADLKKLYEKGENPEGIKIGSNNIFVMSEDAKDKILKKLGYDLQPDGTLKLDQIMEILKLANETVSGSMAVENTERKDSIKKIDHLKDLIKGLSEKVGLGSSESSNTASGLGDKEGGEGIGHDMGHTGDEEGPGSEEMIEGIDDQFLDEVEEVEDIADLSDDVEFIEGGDEEEILDEIEDAAIDEIADTDTDDLAEAAEIDEAFEDVLVEEDTELDDVDDVGDIADLADEEEYIEGGDEEEISDDIEDAVIDEITDTDTDDLVEASEIEETLEDVLVEEDAELEDVEEVNDAEAMLEGEASEEPAVESGLGEKDALEDIGPGQDSGRETTGVDTETTGTISRGDATSLAAGDKEGGEGVGPERGDSGDEDKTGSMEIVEVLDDQSLDEVEEVGDIADLADDVEYIEGGDEEEISDDIEDAVIDVIADTDTDDLAEAAEIDEAFEDVLVEEDTELDDVDDVDGVEENIGDDISEDVSGGFGAGDKDTLEDIGLGQDSGKEVTGVDAGGAEALSRDGETGLEVGDKEGGEGIGHDVAENARYISEEAEEQKEGEQLGLAVGSLGQEYSIEADSNIKKNKRLSEEFDGYLGSMDRYYNHYILIPGGEYKIGSKHPKKDEKPEQMIYLEAYYFGRFPITNGLFEIFVEKTGYKTTAEKFGYGTVYYGRFEKKKDEKTGFVTSTWNSSLCCKTVKGACWYQPSGPKSTLYNKRNHPVVQVSMEDAMAFAAWTGKRLPTENEWEAASRTENGRIFPWGQEWKEDACNIEDSYTADTTPVDKYVEFENDYGIVDTIGNVLEWTNDRFDSTSERKHGSKYRAVRGGSWISGNDIRSFSRFMIEPESHSNILGFRCVAY